MRSDVAGSLSPFRLLAAMSISLLLHGLILFAFAPQKRDSSVDGLSSLQVHLLPRGEAAASPLPSRPLPAPHQPRRASLQHDVTVLAEPTPPAVAAPPGGLPLDMPVLEDAITYEVRELDQFPQPAMPLAQEDWLVHAPSIGSISVALVIDADGTVQEAHFIGVELEGTHDLLEKFKSIRFVPARREGRAVRSRVAMTLDLGG